MTGLFFGLGACDYPPPPAPAPGLDASTAQQLFDRLDRLAAALEAMPRQTGTVAVPGATVAERMPVSEPTNEFDARLAALEREVAMLRAQSGSSFAQPRTAPVPPLQLHALEQMRSQLDSKDLSVTLEARRSVFGLTPQQVLERFGAPTSVEVTNEHTRLWVWSVEERFDFCVVFVDGFATSID